MLLYAYPLTRELINYFSPLTKVSVAFYAKQYVEDRYSIDVKIDSVQAFYPENACIDVNFTTKCEPYIHFVYECDLLLTEGGDNYYASVANYVLERDTNNIIKNIFKGDLIEYKHKFYIELKEIKRIGLPKNISDVTLKYFYNHANITTEVYLKSYGDRNYDIQELYKLINMYKNFGEKYLYIDIFYLNEEEKEISHIFIDVNKINSEQDIIDILEVS